MYDWLYAIPLAMLILGSGITYFMSSSLFGPFCIILSIVIIVFLRKKNNTEGLTWKWLCFFKHKWVVVKDPKYPADRFSTCSRCGL